MGHKVVLQIKMEMMVGLEAEEVQRLLELLTLEDAELLVKEMMVVEEQKYQVVLVVEEVVLVLQVLMHPHKHQIQILCL
mgnify:CR=1 FL=1